MIIKVILGIVLYFVIAATFYVMFNTWYPYKHPDAMRFEIDNFTAGSAFVAFLWPAGVPVVALTIILESSAIYLHNKSMQLAKHLRARKESK